MITFLGIDMMFLGLALDMATSAVYSLHKTATREVRLLSGIFFLCSAEQSGRSPKVVALFSATNFSSNIIELLQLHDTIQIKWNYEYIHYNIAIRSFLMI